MDSEYSSYRDGKYVSVPKIEELCLILKDKFLRQEEENDHLKETIKNLRDEHYKDEEIAKLNEELLTLRKAFYRGFPMTEEESKKANEWIAKRAKYVGAIGGQFSYVFRPTGIGTIGKIIDDTTNEEFVFRELD